jgi:hypothetical protein
LPFVEVVGLRLDPHLFVVTSHGPLFLFKPVLFGLGELKVSVFEGTLIWSEPGIGGS